MTTEQNAPLTDEVPAGSPDVEVELESATGPDAEIERLQAELQQAQETALRAAADAQNTRRRAEQDVEKAHKFGQEKIVQDMVVVADNLERALASVDASDEQFATVVEGLQLTLKSLIDGLKRHHVVQLDPKGEPFDPQFHQAMTQVPNPELEPNTVMDVFQKGYTLHGRLVRPAMVVVSKAP
ncbi:hypothetical protein R50072_29610 [Simiduia litorea]